ncbi:site-specific DNA-methyltransferase [Phascolarctobacterium faecium]|jgi:site-specific DNA-methyltransferase (adenine-specific)|uniref:site-specific DNA-methyltransferase n=1 Tax=Phascolarctobacterium faecium TaxID=33025 RepID=UPI003AF1D1D3
MDKMRMESVDMTAQNIDKIGSMFPNCITETIDENGKPKKAINFELLKQMLSDEVIDGEEAYEFTWVGKKAAIVEAHKPIRKTLRPCKEESKEWDKTENLYIEGDNLEVLKLLQESYLNKVKMIYIDPPYNTGNDFIYNDDFKMSVDEYADEISETDADGNRMFKNTESNGRFHSDWCSMVYSRLILARNLLTEDGIIFISIDDNEVYNLRKICDEIFGGSNYINQFAWVSNITGRQISGYGAAKTWESVLVYSKCATLTSGLCVNIEFAKSKMPDAYKGFNKDIRHDKHGEFAVGDTLYNHNRKFNEETRKNLVFSIFYNPRTEEIITGNIGEVIKDFIEIPPHKNGDGIHKYHAWRWSKQKISKESYNLIVLPNSKNGYEIYTRIRDFNTTLLKDIITNIPNGELEVQKLFNNKKYFDYPKSVDLLKTFLGSVLDKKAIILDFFSGSATTAHAVMQLNAEDCGNRKFIMVQLPEKTDEKSEAYKAGYKNICEIGKERIRRAGDKIKAETGADIDYGFRVLKVDDSNMTDVYYSADEYDQNMLSKLESNVKADRSDIDLLFGCLLEWGLPLSLPYKSEQIEGCTVHTYNDGDLIACFDKNVPDNVIKTVAKRKPLRAVFRDNSFANSPAKINVTEIFKLLAPDTRVKVI